MERARYFTKEEIIEKLRNEKKSRRMVSELLFNLFA